MSQLLGNDKEEEASCWTNEYVWTKAKEEDEQAHTKYTSRNAVEPLSRYSPSIIIDDVEEKAAKEEENSAPYRRSTQRDAHTQMYQPQSPIID